VIVGVVLQILAATLSTLVSYNRAVLSALAVARVCPSGLKATDLTLLVWPVRAPSGLGWRRSRISHNRTVLSELAVARVHPSGLKVTEFTAPAWPVRVASRLG
jgi:hypothetical protein